MTEQHKLKEGDVVWLYGHIGVFTAKPKDNSPGGHIDKWIVDDRLWDYDQRKMRLYDRAL